MKYRKMSSVFAGDDVNKAIAIAASRLGYAQLRPEQKKAVREFVNGSDVFVSLPTGSGKSLCYAVLPAVFDILHQSDISLVLACPVEFSVFA